MAEYLRVFRHVGFFCCSPTSVSVHERIVRETRFESVEGLHSRLVSLEADKLVEIEKFLTKDQLKQLCEIRQSAPPPVPDEVTSRTDAARIR